MSAQHSASGLVMGHVTIVGGCVVAVEQLLGGAEHGGNKSKLPAHANKQESISRFCQKTASTALQRRSTQ